MSTVTVVAGAGDPELARLLASAASAGWAAQEGATVTEVARRCEWPRALTELVTDMDRDEVAALAAGSRLVWQVFSSPATSIATLNGLLGAPRLRVVEGDGRPRLSVVGSDRPAERLLSSAALGLLEVLEQGGAEALGICGSDTCDQPVLRVGRKAHSRACSPRCANRQRVVRHRAKGRSDA